VSVLTVHSHAKAEKKRQIECEARERSEKKTVFVYILLICVSFPCCSTEFLCSYVRENHCMISVCDTLSPALASLSLSLAFQPWRLRVSLPPLPSAEEQSFLPLEVAGEQCACVFVTPNETCRPS
jgi:hypothetical protein